MHARSPLSNPRLAAAVTLLAAASLLGACAPAAVQAQAPGPAAATTMADAAAADTVVADPALLAVAAGSRPTVVSQSGLASWYGPGFAGNHTANGEIFDPSELTAAHKELPFNTLVR